MAWALYLCMAMSRVSEIGIFARGSRRGLYRSVGNRRFERGLSRYSIFWAKMGLFSILEEMSLTATFTFLIVKSIDFSKLRLQWVSGISMVGPSYLIEI